jgi:hypothetical protein
MKDISKVDRIIGVVSGGAVIVLGVVYGSWLGLVGLLPLSAGLVEWAAQHKLFGIDTGNAETANTDHRNSIEI